MHRRWRAEAASTFTAMNAPSALPPHIGKYQVQAELGRGASGVVYRAVDAFKRRQVAIKQLHAHLLRQPEQAERYRKLLRNEVMLTARLRHRQFCSFWFNLNWLREYITISTARISII